MSKEREVLEVRTPIRTQAELEADKQKLENELHILESQPDHKPTDDEIARHRAVLRSQEKARLVQVLDRGVVHDRLKVDLPPDLHGEWVRKDPLEIDRMKTIGFELDSTYAPNRAIHSDGSGAEGVADVIFMTIPKWKKELIDEVRQDQFNRINGRPGDENVMSKEEKDFRDNVARDTGGEIPAIMESKTRAARKSEIEEALSKIQKQIQPVP